MEELFSPQRDITPMRGDYFGASSGLRSSEMTMLDRKYGQEEDRGLDRMLKIATAIDQKRHSDLRYESNILSLQRARDKAAQERDTYTKLPALFGELQGVMNDPELSPYEQQAHMAGLGMKYPMLLSTNAAARTILNSASSSVDMKFRQQDAAAKAMLKAQSDAASRVKGALPDYDKAITDIRNMSDKLEPASVGMDGLGGALPQGGAAALTSSDKVMVKSYAKRHIGMSDKDFAELYKQQGEQGALNTILGTLVDNRGAMASNIRGVNVVEKGMIDDPSKY